MKRNVIIVIASALLLVGCNAKNKAAAGGIVAMTPALTEIVIELGQSERIVATSVYTDDSRVAKVTRVQAEGSLETIVALRPDIVFLQPFENLFAQKLNQMGIKTATYSLDTLSEIEESTLKMGSALNQADLSQKLVEQMKNDLVKNRQHYAQDGKLPKALIVVDRLDTRMQQFYIAQKPAFLADIIEGCGFEVISVGKKMWDRIDAETLIKLNPDWIIYFAHNSEDAKDTKILFTSRYSTLSAVQNDQLFVYKNQDAIRPGPGIAKRQKDLCEALKNYQDSLNKKSKP